MFGLGTDADDVGRLHSAGAAENRLQRAVAVLAHDAVEDERERPGRLGPGEVLGEGLPGLADEAVRLWRMQPALDGHDPLGRDMAGLDAEHGIASFSQGGLDVADQHGAVGVPPFEVTEQHIQPVHGPVCAGGDLPQHPFHIGQAQTGATEQADELSGANLGDVIPAVTGGPVGQHGPEQANAVIEAQRSVRQACSPRELTDRDEPGPDIVRHGPDPGA